METTAIEGAAADSIAAARKDRAVVAGRGQDAGDAAPAAAAPPEAEVIEGALDDIEFQIVVGRCYARMRSGFLDFCSKAAGFTALVGATTAVSDAFPNFKLIAGVIAAAAGVAEPVFNFGRRSYEWSAVAQADQDLLTDLAEQRRAGMADPIAFHKRYHAVKSPDEAEFQSLRKFAWNAAAIELGRKTPDDPELCPITRWERFTANIFPRMPGMPVPKDAATTKDERPL